MKKLLVILVIVATASCAKVPPETSPEGKVAAQATLVVQALRASLVPFKAMVCQSTGQTPTCVRPDDAIKVIQKLQEATKYAEQLVAILRVVDSTTDPALHETEMGKAVQVMATIQAFLTQASIAPANEEARLQVASLFGKVTVLLMEIGVK
jgi:hypothetical protein